MAKTFKSDSLDIFREAKEIKFSYFVLYLFSLALLYKYAYFRAFNVDITTFISLSDLSVFFIDLLPKLIYLLFLILLIGALFVLISFLIGNITGKLFRKKDQLEDGEIDRTNGGNTRKWCKLE